MKELNDLFALAQRAAAKGNSIESLDPHKIIATVEAFLALEQRAEAAEEKLAELEKQEPVAWTSQANLDTLKSEPRKTLEFMTGDKSIYSNPVPLFALRAPAFSLADLVPEDYFAWLVSKARNSADKAITKFPQPNYVLLKVAEEAGEVVQAGVHYAENRMTWQEVESEVVQLMAMLIRLVTEGDQVNGITPPEACRAAILRNIEEQSK